MSADSEQIAKLRIDPQLNADVGDVATSAVTTALTQVHTCLPGIVTAYNSAQQTVSVQPCIKRIFAEQGPVNLPLCLDVPVMFPSGGPFVLTFPIAAGDECLLMFSERAIDYWFVNGGVQLPSEYRLHDLSDAFAFIGVSSVPRAIESVSTSDVQLRSRDGETFVSLAPAGDIKLTNSVGEYHMQPGGTLQITYPQVVVIGNVQIQGDLDMVAGGGGSSGSGVISGDIHVTGDVVAGFGSANVSLLTHTHSGVTSGPDDTGAPN